jgi:phosphoglycolate phosphatase
MRLLFDLDGTLYQARDTAVASVKTIFEELGLPEPDETCVIANIGRTTDVFIKNIFPDTVDPGDIRERLHRHERRLIRERGKLFHGIPDVLRQLAEAGHRLSVVSNGSLDYIRLVLETTGADRYFDSLYSAGRHQSKACFVAELLSPGEQAVFIGDSYDDIEAGVSNRIPAIAALYGYGDKARLTEATFAAGSPEDIAAFISQIGIFARIRERLIAEGRRVIGVSGVDTSGKTVFTDNFARYLRAVGQKCAVIHMDDFHNPLEIRRKGTDEIDAYYRNAFNYRQLTEELLEPLRTCGSIDREVLCLNLDTDRYENPRRYSIDGETVVLIEGVLLFRPPVADYLDGRVFLHIGFDEVLKRARVRDVPKYGEAFLRKYEEKYIPVQKRYLGEFPPRLTSDIVVDNSDIRRPEII